jgi:hypothetical protein
MTAAVSAMEETSHGTGRTRRAAAQTVCRWLIPSVAACLITGIVLGAPLTDSEVQRRAMNDACDKLNLRKKTEFVVDKADAFLKVPEHLAADTSFDRARVAPVCKLQICPDLVPEHFSSSNQYMACWANWAYVSRSDDNRFFMAASDHLAVGCDISIYVYEPGAKALRKRIDVDELLGWKKDQYTDGKLHGYMGVVSNEILWGATHYGVEPDAKWYAAGYKGAWLFSYNLKTDEGRNWGNPLPGNSLSCFTVDTRRGRLIGTGEMGGFLHWDCNAKEVKYAAKPPNGWIWGARSMLLDPDTGVLWGQELSEPPARFISFNPADNRFERYETRIPMPAGAAGVLLRGHTEKPARDGFFYWATQAGQLFKFKPQEGKEPIVQAAVVTSWGEGRDTLQMALSPKGRYVYYYSKGDSTPVVQYDVTTGRRKALCWLQDYYFEKYGYYMGEIYGLNISTDGSFLVACMNGTFANNRSSAFGHPACLVIEIPAEERPE